MLVGQYGEGAFGELGLLTPFGTNKFVDLVEHARRLLSDHQPFRDPDSAPSADEFPYPLYPEAGGLLEWGGTGNGARLCWLTEGEPDSWPVVVWNYGYGSDRYDVGAVEFVYTYLSGQREVEQFGPPPALPWFDSYTEVIHVYVKLSEGDLSYDERLRILRQILAPTGDRGSFLGDDGSRQDHFKAVDRDWLVTYETAYGHQIRVAFPPDDEEEARTVILDAARAMGCQALRATIDGLPTWSDYTGAPGVGRKT